MGKKKVNPRRIPLPKSAINKDKIIEEAMKDDMYHAWILVASALLETELAKPEQIGTLCDEISEFAKKVQADDMQMIHAEELMGRGKPPRLNTSYLNSPVELEKFKKKVEKLALHTALCVICLGLEIRYTADELRRIFLSADLTEAELESGRTNYKELEEALLAKMVKIEVSPEL